MNTSIVGAIQSIQLKLKALPNIKIPPNGPPESINVFPFGVSYLSNGSLTMESEGWAKHFHTIYSEVHVSRQLLPQAIALAVSYIEPFFAALMADPSLGGNVALIQDVRYKFGRLEWGGIETFGERFEIDVKLLLP